MERRGWSPSAGVTLDYPSCCRYIETAGGFCGHLPLPLFIHSPRIASLPAFRKKLFDFSSFFVLPHSSISSHFTVSLRTLLHQFPPHSSQSPLSLWYIITDLFSNVQTHRQAYIITLLFSGLYCISVAMRWFCVFRLIMLVCVC